MLVGLQGWIHRLEEGGGVRYVKRLTAILAFGALALTFHARLYQNFSQPEAMDTAQVARNLAEGNGYTTLFIRPLSLYLVQRHRANFELPPEPNHPDLANAPGYPWLVSQWLRRQNFQAAIPPAKEFQTYPPEVWIAGLNYLLFFLVLCATFVLGRRLFDERVAWISVIVLGAAELMWRLSAAGLSTMLLMLILLLLTGGLAAIEQGAREKQWGFVQLLPLAMLTGMLTGAGCLTRYSFGWLIFPVIGFFVVALAQRRIVLCLAVAVAFAAVLSPWLARNYVQSGTLFGTAGLALYKNSDRFPAHQLERSLNPRQLDTTADLGKVGMNEHWRKLIDNAGQIVRHDLPRLGGSWITAFFLAGLLVPFNRSTLSRLRIFLLLSLALLLLVQALGKTHLSEDNPEVSSENLLVLLAPLVFMFGAAMFFLLLDQLHIEFPPTRNLIAALFCLVISAPLIFALLSPRRTALAYPPYYPPFIQETAGWLDESELMMSDIPWAVAWYGRQPCVWLTVDDEKDFQTLHRLKPIQGLYLTQLTLDQRLISDLIKGPESAWGRFAVESVVKQEIPTGFPLKHAFADWFPEQLFLADRPRWQEPER
jgi:hypothetical protein